MITRFWWKLSTSGREHHISERLIIFGQELISWRHVFHFHFETPQLEKWKTALRPCPLHLFSGLCNAQFLTSGNCIQVLHRVVLKENALRKDCVRSQNAWHFGILRLLSSWFSFICRKQFKIPKNAETFVEISRFQFNFHHDCTGDLFNFPLFSTQFSI